MFAALWKLGGGWHGHLLTVNCTVSTWHGWTHNLWQPNLLHLSESLLCLCWFYFSTSDWPLICFLQKFSATNKNFLFFFQVIINIFFTNLLWLSDLGSDYETISSYNSPRPSPSPRHPSPRLEICQKIYTTQFSGEKTFTFSPSINSENASLSVIWPSFG